jgi:ketosteroid isomerase-like protein
MKATAGVAALTAALALAVPGPWSVQVDRERAVASLVEAERAFSKMSEVRGIREAFLTFLAGDAVVFRPAPVAGRPIYEKMAADDPTVLAWEPEVAEVASSGELGYTSGPYSVRPELDAEPASFGHYISVWQREPDGTWKVILDIGIRHDRPAAPAGLPGRVASPAASPLPPLSPEALRDEEHAFGLRAGAFENALVDKGARKALSEFATEDVRVYRPGRFPAVGRSAAKSLISAQEGKVGRAGRNPESRRTSYKVGLSWSGDLAWSYGTVESVGGRAARDGTAYLRIWRRVPPGAWKICLDIVLPVPPPAGN